MPTVILEDIELFYAIYDNHQEVEELNSEKPTIVFLHGGPGMVDHTIYVPFWSKLSNNYQVVFPDQRGNGRSERGDPKKWNLSQCGKDVKSFCDVLNIAKPIIAGVSWGGYVAMAYAEQFPNHPAALIFCNTEAKVSPEARKAAFTRLGGEMAGQAVYNYDTQPNKAGVHDAFIKYCLPYYAKYNPYTREQMERCYRNMDMRKQFMEKENLYFDYRKSLEQIVCPALIIAGSEDGAHPLVSALETAECVPEHFRNFSLITDAGAPVYNDQPEQVLRAISDFLVLIH